MFDFLYSHLAFQSFSDFFQMGKHGVYVWLCYGLSLLTIVVNIVLLRMKRRSIVQSIHLENMRKQKQQQNMATS